MTIVSHIIFALLAVSFGTRNLISKKGDNKHKVIGWIWVLLMFYVAISSYWIRELNDGNYSCLLYTSPSPRDRTRSRMPSSA